MLQHPPAERPDAYASAAQLTIQAAYAALTVSDQAVFAALDALSFVQRQGECKLGGKAVEVAASTSTDGHESGEGCSAAPRIALAAGTPAQDHPGFSFRLQWRAGLEQEAVVLYCELISHRGSWRINAAGCRALADSSMSAAAALLSSGGAPGPLQRCVWPSCYLCPSAMRAPLRRMQSCRCVMAV